MMTATARATSRVNSLIGLKISTFLNSKDHQWAAKEKSKILYLIDADILGLFLETPTDKRQDKPWAHSRVRLDLFEEESKIPLHIPAEYETGEYIFSGVLPAQLEHKLFFADLHLREVESMRNAIVRREQDPATAGAGQDTDDEVRRQLTEFSEEMVAKVEDGISDAEIEELCGRATELTEKLFQPATETLSPRTFRSGQAVLALKRASGRCAPARTLESYRKAAEARPAGQATEWCARIATERKGLEFTSVKRGLEIFNKESNNIRDRILSDAYAIVEMFELNRRMSGSNMKAVLISGTQFMHRAYTRWFLSNQSNQRSDDYFLRHPSQYLPLINIKGYNNAFNLRMDPEKSVWSFENIVLSLDSFLDPLHSRPQFTKVLEKYMEVSRGPPLTYEELSRQIPWFSEKVLEDVVKGWRLAYGNSILIGLPTVERRWKEQEEILRRAIEAVGGDLLAAQNNIVANLETDHMRSALAAIGAEAREELKRLKKRIPSLDAVRGVVIPLVELRPELRACLARAFEGSIRDAIEEVNQISSGQSSETPEPDEIVATISLMMSLGAWAQAKRLTEQCRLSEALRGASDFWNSGPNDDAVVRELRYLYALAVRFECRSTEEYARAFDLLSHLSPGEDALSAVRNGRSLLERGTLQLAAALHRLAGERLDERATWPELVEDQGLGGVDELLEMGRIDLCRAFEILRSAKIERDPELEIKRERLSLQAAINTLSGQVLQKISDPTSNWGNPEFLRTAEEFVRPYYDKSELLRPISLLNFEAFRKLRNPGEFFPGEKGRALLELSEIEVESAMYKRVIAPTDMDLARLYQSLR